MGKVFISYAREDAEMARRLHADLRTYDIDSWLDLENLLPGEMWQPAISQAIKRSSYFLMLISKNSVTKRGYFQKEVRLGLDVLDECAPGSIYFIPVRMDAVEPLHNRVKEIQWVDLWPSYEVGFRRVLQAIGVTPNGAEGDSSEHPVPWTVFEGVWASEPREGLFCSKVIKGELIFRYRFGGDYYKGSARSFTRFGKFIVGRWDGWVQRGRLVLKQEDANLLKGWWNTVRRDQAFDDLLPEDALAAAAAQKNTTIVLRRLPDETFPDWARKYSWE